MPTVPVIGVPVVMTNGGGGGGGGGGATGSGFDTLLLSLQALRPKVTAQIHKQTHNMFLVIVRPFMNALPLFWR